MLYRKYTSNSLFAIAFVKPRFIENHGIYHVGIKAPKTSFIKSRQFCFDIHARRAFGVVNSIPNTC